MIRLRFIVKGNQGMRQLQRQLSPDALRGLHMVWGEAVAKLARSNAVAKGGRRYWHAVADATRIAEAGANGVAVRNDYPGARHKQTGGTIEAPGKGPSSRFRRMLAIPIDPEARSSGHGADYYAASHRLFVVRTRRLDGKGQALLGYAEEIGTFRPLFILKKRVVQKADPWWPSDAESSRIGLSEAQRMFRLRRA